MKGSWKAAAGATMIEFVVVAPIALLLILCLIQTGFLLVAKIELNHAAFMGARIGAMNNADKSKITDAVYKVLLPFWQDASQTNDLERVSTAYVTGIGERLFLTVNVLNPSAASFQDFGYLDPVLKQTIIPNDSLAYRTNNVGSASQETLQDANLLKIKVTYGFKLKVPLMQGLLRSMMCGSLVSPSPVADWGSNSVIPMDSSDCVYLALGRFPLTTYATVRMQSPAYKP
jgi:hypothetical protein